ncbi:penicillin-binding protein 1C [Novispirillum itersonii]|uniref:peptidoglycan glycosyltransferase n=1 Tax=Novispirillum itersonii TaxID=189 RepID=A0A7W9ZCX0_NOVIT|nr:penicillin-binding protein 1C [Novispirillum itersonii]MBB6208918.1 penicillin-binding protein 1C [Novispirillum itersonii]
MIRLRLRLLLKTGLAAALLLGAAAGLDALMPPDLTRWTGRSVRVTDAEGRLLRPFATADGLWRLETGPEDVDPLYLALLRMTEDRRFGWHPGVDPAAVLRAAGQLALHQRVVSGASTLTMQTARLLSPKPRTLSAKLEEALRAVQLQARFGTGGVLRMYLTLAPFGGPLEGVTAATQAWFGKAPHSLSPAEAALLVALPQSPERLRPDRNPEAARAARNRILRRAVDHGLLAAEVVASAMAEPVPVVQRPMPMLAPHLTERLAAALPPEAAAGTVIRTTLNGPLQQRLEELGRTTLSRLNGDADLAVVVVETQSHRVIAHLGSGDWRQRKLDLSMAVRSPGSALKPFIYALAFDDLSLHPGTIIPDAPERFGSWMPNNFDQDFHGQVTAREALQRSLNIPAVLALEQVGPVRFAALMGMAGANLVFPGSDDPGLPVALGGVGIRLMDLAKLYAGLADGGLISPLRLTADAPPGQPYRLVGEAAAHAVMTVLEGSPLPDGVAGGLAVARDRRIGFKTGTSFGFRDAWTIGASADYTVAVWVGRADGSGRPGQMGRTAAAPLLFRVFDLLPPDRGPRRPPRDPDHALFRSQPPVALRVLGTDPAEPAPTATRERLRILFPPDGSTVEPLEDGIALKAAGGRPPLRWVANGVPLPMGATFWQPDSSGFSRLSVVDADGRRSAITLQVARPETD